MNRILKILFATGLLLTGTVVPAQQRQAMPDQEELMRISKLPPAEQEKYKQALMKKYEQQAKQISQKSGVVINEELLPGTDIKAPVRDVKRLSLIPAGTPTREKVLTEINQTEKVLRSLVPAAVQKEVDSISVQMPANNTEALAVFSWYKNQPYHAVLLAIAAVKKSPETPQGFSNLGAMLNMAGLPERAVPVLKHVVQTQPENSAAFNNLGQSYMKMGDLRTAETYFQQCLSLDKMNPEANHAMAMIEVFRKNLDRAADYFSRELSVVQRPTTLSRMQKKRVKLNLYEIHKQRLQRQGGKPRNYFSEAELEKFEMPQFPYDFGSMKELYQKHLDYQKSVQEEQAYWLAKGPSQEQMKKDGKKGFPLYFDVIEQLLEDLHEDFPPEYLTLYTEDEASYRKIVQQEWEDDLSRLECELPPPGSDPEVSRAYQKVCCEKKVKIEDKYIRKINEHVNERYNVVKNRWKDYINQLIYYVSFAPTWGNRILGYQTIAAYFAFLGHASGSGYFSQYPAECMIDMTLEEAEAIIQSSRNLDIDCPPNLSFKLKFNLKIPVAEEGVKIEVSGDCEEYNLEGSWGPLSSSFHKDFKTGMSTLAVGVEADGKFSFEKYADMELGAKARQEFYVTYDRNNVMADAGFRGNGEAVIEINDLEIVKGEANYVFSMNSGFDGDASGDSVFRQLSAKLAGLLGNSSIKK